ncbi:MAG: ubiquitin-like domain-containing protein [Candidatus Saccharimonadales bacterium]
MRISFLLANITMRHLLIGGTLLLLSIFGSISYASADSNDSSRNGRLITIHDRGGEKVILTHAQTVRDALYDAHIPIVKEDHVEPNLDEQLVATDYTVNIYRARPVIVVDGMLREKIMTAAQTTSAIASEANIELHDEDKTKLSISSDIVADGAGVMLTIDRATPFIFELYGTARTAYTSAKTVGEMLKIKHIVLEKDDTLSVPAETAITPNMKVALLRNGIQTTTVEEPVVFSTRRIQDVDQSAGYRKVQTPGTNGRKSVTYEIIVQNGIEISRRAIQTVVLEQPKEQVEIVGAKPSFSGDFAAALAKLRSCESGGNYANKKNPSYRGAYQYSYSTWANYGGYYDPADAPVAVQDQAARNTYVRRGWQPWPHCGKSLPDTYR